MMKDKNIVLLSKRNFFYNGIELIWLQVRRSRMLRVILIIRLKALISTWLRDSSDQRLKALIYRTQSLDCSCPLAIISISVLMILQESICVDFLLVIIMVDWMRYSLTSYIIIIHSNPLICRIKLGQKTSLVVTLNKAILFPFWFWLFYLIFWLDSFYPLSCERCRDISKRILAVGRSSIKLWSFKQIKW